MKTVALLLAFCALSGLIRAAPILRTPWIAGKLVFHPGGPILEKAITAPRELSMMLRGIDPALEFIHIFGRTAHPGELIGGLNTFKKALQSDDPIVAGRALTNLRRIGDEPGTQISRHGHLKAAAQTRSQANAAAAALP